MAIMNYVLAAAGVVGVGYLFLISSLTGSGSGASTNAYSNKRIAIIRAIEASPDKASVDAHIAMFLRDEDSARQAGAWAQYIDNTWKQIN